MRRIGIYGGTFNPIHYAHLILAWQALVQYDLNTVIFLPSKRPPHKSGTELADDKDRIEMVRLAIEDNPKFALSTIEFEREGYSYTADSLMELKKTYKDDELFFIVGGDSLFEMDNWSRPEIIFKLAHVLYAGRSNRSEFDLVNAASKLKNSYSANISSIIMPQIDISSHEIRAKIQNHESVKYFLPSNVEEYIINNRIYLNDRL